MPKDSGDSEGHESLFGTDSSAEDTKSKDTSDTKVEIDWESDDNPYKTRAKGFQSEGSKARNELESRKGDQAALARIEAQLGDVQTQMDTIADYSAEAADFSERRGSDDLDDDDSDDSQSRRSTNARTERNKAAREERSKSSDTASHTALVSEVREKIGSIYTQDMNKNPKVQEAAKLFQGAVEDPAKANDLWRALEMMREGVAESSSQSDDDSDKDDEPDKDESKKSQSSKDDASGDDKGDKDDDEEDTPTKRESLIDDPKSQGQTHVGQTPSMDEDNMTATEMFEADLAGKKPAGIR